MKKICLQIQGAHKYCRELVENDRHLEDQCKKIKIYKFLEKKTGY